MPPFLPSAKTLTVRCYDCFGGDGNLRMLPAPWSTRGRGGVQDRAVAPEYAVGGSSAVSRVDRRGMTRQRAVVVGLGQFGVEHLRSYLELGHEICAAVDISEDRRRLIAERYAVPVAADAAKAIRLTRPSLVSIVTGPHQHRRLVEAALSVGARVLVEKPFAATVQEAQAIAELPGVADAVTPGHILRFDAAHRWVAHHVASGLIGSVIAIDSERHREHGHAQRYADHSLASLTLYHDLDLATWLDGHRPMTVSAAATPSVAGASPTYLAATVRTDADTLWTLRCSWQLPENAENRDRLQVFGSTGTIELVMVGDAATATVTSTPGSPVASTQVFASADALRDEIAEFADGRARSVVSIADAVSCVRLVGAVEDSAKRGAAVPLNGGGLGRDHQEGR